MLGLKITILISGCPSSKARAVLSTKDLAEGEYFPFWELGNSKSGSNQSSISSLMGGSNSFGFEEPGKRKVCQKCRSIVTKICPLIMFIHQNNNVTYSGVHISWKIAEFRQKRGIITCEEINI